jgi:branched-chain amino acid transport system permease protein
VVIGFPAVRLRGFFLAIATLALGMAIVELITFARPLTGGGAGMNVTVFALPGIKNSASTYFVVLAIAAIMFFLVRRRWWAGSAAPYRRCATSGRWPVARRLAAALPAGRVRAVRVHRRRGGHALRTAADVHLPGDVRMNLLVPMLVMVFVGAPGRCGGR